MKPEKILGKKFVRGKPYYRIKWVGTGKEQSTWESPPNLEKYKAMINNYEVKNWGTQLDQKFFNPEIYVNKGFANRSKSVSDRKSMKILKRKEKKKIEENVESSENYQSSSEEEHSQGHQETKKTRSYSINEGVSERNKKNQKLEAKKNESKVAQILILDSDEEPNKQKNCDNILAQYAEDIQKNEDDRKMEENKQEGKRGNIISDGDKQCVIAQKQHHKQQEKEIQIISAQKTALVEKNGEENKLRADEPQNLINLDSAEVVRNNQEQAEKSNKFELNLPAKQTVQPRKQLKISEVNHIEVHPHITSQVIAVLYHLEKLSVGNHLYLVEFESKKMLKLSTSQLLQWHPVQFINYLEKKLVVKKNSS